MSCGHLDKIYYYAFWVLADELNRSPTINFNGSVAAIVATLLWLWPNSGDKFFCHTRARELLS